MFRGSCSGWGVITYLPRRVFACLDPKHNSNIQHLACRCVCFSGCPLPELRTKRRADQFRGLPRLYGCERSRRSTILFSAPGRTPEKLSCDALVPVLGFLFCLVIWLSLPNRAKIIGALWFAVGVTYDGLVTRGFRTPPAMIDLAEFSASSRPEGRVIVAHARSAQGAPDDARS